MSAIVAIVVTQLAHDVRPDTCGIFVEDGIRICWNGKPGSVCNSDSKLPWPPSGISNIGAKGLAPLTGSQNTIDEVCIPAETNPIEDMMRILWKLIQSIQHHDLVCLHRPPEKRTCCWPSRIGI